VLDEAMAPLDDQVQRQLIADLRRLGTTVIFCAHRPSTLALADRVVELRCGRIEGRAERLG
jgi:ABC-type bacteriocin/lantibiotic exporter with double-glycine peptidase domain